MTQWPSRNSFKSLVNDFDCQNTWNMLHKLYNKEMIYIWNDIRVDK